MSVFYDSLLLKNLEEITIDDIDMMNFIVIFTVETIYDTSEICEVRINLDLEKLYTKEVTPTDFILDFVTNITSLIPKEYIFKKKDDSFYEDEADFQNISIFLANELQSFKLVIPPIYIKTTKNWIEILNKLILLEASKTIKV